MTEPVDLQRVTSSRSRLMLRSSQSAHSNDAGSVLGSVQEGGPYAGQVDTGVAINNHPSKSFSSVQGHNIQPHVGEGRQLVDISEIPYGGYYEERRRSRGNGCLKGVAVVALCVLVGLSSAFLALSMSTRQTVKKTLQANTLTRDTDGDGLSDDLELRLGLDPLKWDTNGDGKSDGQDVGFLVGTEAMMMAAPKSPKASTAPKSPKAPSAPKSPKAPTAPKSPKAPTAPKSPKAPSAPKSPKAPTAPKSPKAPSAPKSPKAPSTPSGSSLVSGSSTVPATRAAADEEAPAVTTTEEGGDRSSEEAPAVTTTEAAVIDDTEV